jgi:hypothetical protein
MIRRSLNPVLLTALATMSLGQQQGPPNNLWPVRRLVDVRAGCHVLVVASWGRAGKPRVRPLEAFDPLWDELCSWLAQCPVLTDIETFWVHDGRGWSLLVTGVELAAEPEITTVRIPAGTITYDEAPLAIRDVQDHGYVEVRVVLSPEDVAKIQRERETLSAGYSLAEFEAPRLPAAPRYEIRQQPIRADYVALMPDGSLETVADGRLPYPELDPFETAVVKHWPTLAHRIYRADQRANRRRRAARKRKRGWA